MKNIKIAISATLFIILSSTVIQAHAAEGCRSCRGVPRPEYREENQPLYYEDYLREQQEMNEERQEESRHQERPQPVQPDIKHRLFPSAK